LKTLPIKQLNIKEVFPTTEDARDWIIENPEQLATALQTELSYVMHNPKITYMIRPDICALEKQTSYRFAVMIDLDEISERDFVKFLTVAAFTDIKKIVWVVSRFSNINHYILEWLNDHAKGNVEFVVLNLSAYEMPNSKIATKLERLERIPVPAIYEDLI